MGTYVQSSATRPRLWRSRWAAIGAAIAVTLGGGGLVAVNAASSAESSSALIDPVRILDTRDPLNVGLAGPFTSAISQKLQVSGPVPTTSGVATPVPAGATGVILNVTAVGATANGFISIRPGNATGAPATSSLNVTAGVTVPNAVTVALPTSGPNAGQIDITWDALGVAGPTTDILIDVVGYSTSAKLDALQAKVDALQAKVDAPRTQTVSYSGFDMTDLGAFQLGSSNGCAVNLAARSGMLTLQVPTGARLIDVNAVIYDDSGASTYSVSLYRYASNGLGDGAVSLATATGGAGSIVSVTKSITPTTPEVVDAGEHFVVSFDDGVNAFGNGLCSVNVTYQLPSAGAASSSDQSSTDSSPTAPVCDDPTACQVETP